MPQKTQIIEVPGVAIPYEFPADMPDDQIQAAIQQDLKEHPPQPPGPPTPDQVRQQTEERRRNLQSQAAPPPETVSERVRRLAGQAYGYGQRAWEAVRPENPVRTGFGMVGAGVGGTASLPSWVGSPLVGVPLSAAAGAAGYTGGTHIYDLITGSMPGGARTPGEYAATIPAELAAGAWQEGPAEALSGFTKTVTTPFLSTAAGAAEKAGEKGGTEATGKLFGWFAGGEIGEILAHLAGIPHGRQLGEAIGALRKTQAWQRASPAVRDALINMLNNQGTQEVVTALQGELVRRQLASGGGTMTGLPPGVSGADQIRPIPPTGRAEFLRRLQEARGAPQSGQPLWSQQEGLLPTSSDLVRRR